MTRWILLALTLGCGTGPTRDVPPQQKLEPLPDIPRGTLWGEGFGATARDAVLDARRAVSEQVVAQMSSRVESRVTETNGAAERDAHQRVDTRSAFAHVELLVTLGVVPRDDGFVARVALDRERALEVYGTEQSVAARKIDDAVPVLTEALRTLDTSVLLAADKDPRHHLAAYRRASRVLGLLGQRSGPAVEAQVAGVAELRSKAVIRLSVVGGRPGAVNDAVVGAVTRRFEARGCSVTGPATLELGVPTADAVLRIETRAHEEAGLKWRYLGLAVELVDARSERPVFRYVALPDFVHAGGPSWPQADKALARRLEERLVEKAAPAFQKLSCR